MVSRDQDAREEEEEEDSLDWARWPLRRRSLLMRRSDSRSETESRWWRFLALRRRCTTTRVCLSLSKLITVTQPSPDNIVW
jgi:hypothetical protein